MLQKPAPSWKGKSSEQEEQINQKLWLQGIETDALYQSGMNSNTDTTIATDKNGFFFRLRQKYKPINLLTPQAGA